MALTELLKKDIEEIIREKLKDKLKKLTTEPADMPFHFRLLGKKRMALYSFIHSINTIIGTSMYEKIAAKIAKENYKFVAEQATSGNHISKKAREEIQDILEKLNNSETVSNKIQEIEKLRKVASEGKKIKVTHTKIDLMIETEDGEQFLIDIKTAKPNIGDFKHLKRTLLEWVATRLFDNKEAKINTLIAIPYNPYDPEPYQRWTKKNMFDPKHDIKVAAEFWDFIGGEGTYEDLKDCFERVGNEMEDELKKCFDRF